MSGESLRYQIVEGVLARPLGDSVVLFHPETERLLTLTGSGPRIWSLLEEHPEVDQIVERLMAEYEGPESVIRQQTLELLADLETEQIVRQGACPPPPAGAH